MKPARGERQQQTNAITVRRIDEQVAADTDAAKSPRAEPGKFLPVDSGNHQNRQNGEDRQAYRE